MTLEGEPPKTLLARLLDDHEPLPRTDYGLNTYLDCACGFTEWETEARWTEHFEEMYRLLVIPSEVTVSGVFPVYLKLDPDAPNPTEADVEEASRLIEERGRDDSNPLPTWLDRLPAKDVTP